MDQLIQNAMTLVTATVTTFGLRALGAVAILFFGRLVARWARKLVRHALERATVDEVLIPFLSGVTYFALMAGVVMAALKPIGVETTALITIFGAAGLAIALAFQGTLSNFSSGVMLLFFRPISLGHFVDVGGTVGTVAQIDVFTTTLNTPDNIRIIVPNSSIFGQTITNYSANATRRIELVIGVSYDDELGQAIEVIAGVVNADSRVLADPECLIAVSELGDSSVNLVVRPWCDSGDFGALRFDLTRGIKEALDQAGISMPYPQRDVHMHQVA